VVGVGELNPHLVLAGRQPGHIDRVAVARIRPPPRQVVDGDRLVLLGRNGVGKSQLIAMLRLVVAQQVAGVRVGPSIVLGHAAQGMAHLPGGETPHRCIAARPGLSDGRATSLLASAGLGVDMHHKPIGRLSPGQKARLGLLALRLAEPNLYLLDEPTNHVDIPGQERLEAELLAQEATRVLVSHDRSFARTIGTRFVLIEAGATRELADPAEAGLR
jgi:ATPase subunit of ABC transporter with duplicated ATPase domains